MKKLISGIMAIAILASAVFCGTTTAFAADTGNSAVGDVDMWNHDFKNKLTGELMWAIDDIADTDTVAVEINLTSYYEDIYIFADKNDRLDEIIVNEDGGKTYSDELLRDYEEYKNNIRSQKPDDKKKIIDEKYSVSEIKYFSATECLFCISTKEQILNLGDADIKVSIDLADKDYYSVDTKITWDEFFKIEKQTREYIEQTLAYPCPESDYDIFYFKLSVLSEEVKFDYILVEDHYSSDNNIKSLKTGNFVYPIYEDSPAGRYYYADNKVQNAVELYTNGVIDINTLYDLNAR
ncbi:MAG: hypothetical protein ACLTS8_03390 [Ruminococcus sp.]|jgi:hypothetical protein|uniref:hypothetical protein n=1 Tax=Ruminococcus sp. TaxID=41978 RepID=UPI0026DED38E|nr:hypothetical protein [uncultured Ruminococcus sp.]